MAVAAGAVDARLPPEHVAKGTVTHILALRLKNRAAQFGHSSAVPIRNVPQLYVGVQPTINEGTLQHSDQQDDEAPSTDFASIAARVLSGCPTCPLSISPKKFPKALRLWRQYQSELFKETSGDPPEDLPSAIPESSFLSVPTFGNSDTTRTATTDGGVGKSKVRVRKRLSPLMKKKVALVRWLGPCDICRSRRVPVSSSIPT
jgi:hypothetical protein